MVLQPGVRVKPIFVLAVPARLNHYDRREVIMLYRLAFLTGPFKGKRMSVQQASVTIGRAPECPILIPDDEISWTHAVIEQKEDGIHVRDLGSMNGVMVNNQLVRDALLKNGDVIEIGKSSFQFKAGGQDEPKEIYRVSRTQGIAFVAVVVIVILEIAFLVGLSVWHNRIIQGHGFEITRKTPEKAVPPVTGTESDTLVQAAAHLEERQEEQKKNEDRLEITRDTSTVAQVKEDLKELHKDVAELRKQVEVTGTSEVEKVVEENVPVSGEATGAVPGQAVGEGSEEAAGVEEEKATGAKTPEIQESAETSTTETAGVEVKTEESREEEAGPAPKKAVDPLTQRAREMLKDAKSEIAQKNLGQADRELERIQILAPDFLPAYVERARLFEQRGMLPEASAQWNEAMRRGMGTPLYEQASAERLRLARAEMLQKTVTEPSPSRETAPAESQPERRIRIVNVEQQRLPDSDQYEEMRLVRVILRPKPGEEGLDSSAIRVVVTFFDENKANHEVSITRANAPPEPLRLDGEWRPNEQSVATAAYMVLKGFRDQEFKEISKQLKYFGYVIQVYYGDALQDEDARPKSLLQKTPQIPKPAIPAVVPMKAPAVRMPKPFTPSETSTAQ